MSARSGAASRDAGDARLGRLGAEWDELAGADAMWAVLSDPERRGGGWSEEAFFASGEQEIAGVLERLAALGVPGQRRRALDFGCGLGRLARALAGRFDEVVGVDVSEAMVEQGSRLNAGVAGLRLVVNRQPDLSLFPNGSFDLVYTNLVLQHLPSRDLMAAFVRELVRVTAPGGVAAIQAPARIPVLYRAQPLRRGYALLRRLGVPSRLLILRTPLQPMRMTALPRERVEEAVSAAGGRLLAADPDGAFGFRYVVAGPEQASA